MLQGTGRTTGIVSASSAATCGEKLSRRPVDGATAREVVGLQVAVICLYRETIIDNLVAIQKQGIIVDAVLRAIARLIFHADLFGSGFRQLAEAHAGEPGS
jgi:hypothetical protein